MCAAGLGVKSLDATAQTIAQATIVRHAPVATVPADPEPLQGDTRRTRFVIGLDKSAQFQVFSLANPNRVIVDLPDVRLRMPPPTDSPVGLVRSFRGGLAAPGKTRVVIDVTSPVIVDKVELEAADDGKGYHLVLDIVPVDEPPVVSKNDRKALKATPSALGAAGLQPPLPRRALSPREQAARTFKPTIVIDPGHGGHDSGAMKFGTVEKEVVLAFSLMLRDKLRATGRYNVLMTREDDVFIPLDERREFGEKNKAALFIAVHADYASTSARGATIYSLRESMANDLKRSAKGEVASNVLSSTELAAVRKTSADVDAVQSILSDLAQREVEMTKERTNLFTRTVVEKMSATTNLRDDPDRSANFRVLLSAKVPSVLIELAYVSNAQDAKLLKSHEWRSRVSGSIVTAIENYFSNQSARLPM